MWARLPSRFLLVCQFGGRQGYSLTQATHLPTLRRHPDRLQMWTELVGVASLVRSRKQQEVHQTELWRESMSSTNLHHNCCTVPFDMAISQIVSTVVKHCVTAQVTTQSTDTMFISCTIANVSRRNMIVGLTTASKHIHQHTVLLKRGYMHTTCRRDK